MKKTRNLLICILISLIFMSFVGINHIYAGDITYSDGSTTSSDGVYQGEDNKNYAKDAPMTNIYIIDSLVDEVDDANNAITKLNTEAEADGFYISDGLGGHSSITNMLFLKNYDETNSTSAFTQKVNTFSYDDPIVTYKFQDAAQLSDGTYGDVVVAYEEVTCILTDEGAKTYYGSVSFGNGNGFHGSLTPSSKIPNSSTIQRVGIKIKAKVYVEKNGNRINGSFYFPIKGLTVVRSGGWETVFSDYSDLKYFSEGTIVNGGYLSNKAGNSFFIPGGTEKKDGVDIGYTSEILDLDGKKYFRGNLSPSLGDESFYAGFMAVADNKKGFDFTYIMGVGVQGNNGKTYNINNSLLYGVDNDGNSVNYQIKATTGKGGTVETTAEGNIEGDLSDGTTIYNSDKEPLLTGTGGKKITYKLTPKPGYKLKSAKVINGTIDINGSGSYDVDPVEHVDANGNTYYTYSFNGLSGNGIAEDNALHVEWEPMKYKVNYDANGGNGNMDSQNFTGEDETMNSKENEFTKPGYEFEGFKLLDKNGKPILDENGNEIIINNPNDLKDVLLPLGDNGEVTLQAMWKPSEYKINYDPNGGSGNMPSQNFTGEDSSMNSKGNEFTRSGYKFEGFKLLDKEGKPILDKNGNEIIVDNPENLREFLIAQGIGGEVTLQAMWSKEEITPAPIQDIPPKQDTPKPSPQKTQLIVPNTSVK